jgi:hypothetical protein
VLHAEPLVHAGAFRTSGDHVTQRMTMVVIEHLAQDFVSRAARALEKGAPDLHLFKRVHREIDEEVIEAAVVAQNGRWQFEDTVLGRIAARAWVAGVSVNVTDALVRQENPAVAQQSATDGDAVPARWPAVRGEGQGRSTSLALGRPPR